MECKGELKWTILCTTVLVVFQLVFFLASRCGRSKPEGKNLNKNQNERVTASIDREKLIEREKTNRELDNSPVPAAPDNTSGTSSSMTSDASLQMHPIFPTLSVTETTTSKEMFPNSRKPIPFKTSLFEGKALFMLVSDPPDPFFAKHFSGRKRLMELHFQGKFLEKPKGTLYIGGEIEEKMNIGVVLRTMAGMMLRLVKSLSYGDFHHSFGSTKKREKPHIVTSFYNGVDRFHVTPPGEVPPALGRDIPETAEDRSLRRKAPVGTLKINLDATYSFSYHSMYIDLISWQIVKIPGFQPVDLHSYWGNLPLSIPLYDLSGDNSMHTDSQKRYFWRFKFEHTPLEKVRGSGASLDGAPATVVFPPHLLSDSASSTDNRSPNSAVTNSREFKVTESPENEADSDDCENHSSLIRRRSFSADSGSGASPTLSTHTSGLIVDVPAFIECAKEASSDKEAVFVVRVNKSDEAKDGSHHRSTCLVCNTADLCELALFASGDSAAQMKKLTRRIRAIKVRNSNLPLLEAKRRALDNLLVDMSSDPSQQKLMNVLVGGWGRKLSYLLNPTLASRRYRILFSMQSKRDAMSFHSGPMMLAGWESFWREGWGVLTKVPLSSLENRNRFAPVLSFYRVHASQPLLSLQASDILAVSSLSPQCQEGKGGKVEIDTASNYVVGPDLPLPRHLQSGFELHTYGRVFTFAVSSEVAADEWVAILGSMTGAKILERKNQYYAEQKQEKEYGRDNAVGQAAVAAVSAAAAAAERSSPNWVRVGEHRMEQNLTYNSESENQHYKDSDKNLMESNWDPRVLILGNSSHWASPTRTVLNRRRLSFASDISSSRNMRRRPHAGFDDKTIELPTLFACNLSTSILRTALQLRQDSSVADWTKFMDKVAMLKEVNLCFSEPDSKERLLFWFNIFHTLLIHTRLLLGASNSAYGFFKQAKHVSYEIFAVPYRDVYSLLEIEHCILRGASTKPRKSLAGFFLPTKVSEGGKDDVKWDMAPSVSDPRTNFILNYGTLSSLRRIPVFAVPAEGNHTARASIDVQFDLASSAFLQHFAVIDMDTRCVTIPKVLDWYRGDFGKTIPSHRGMLLEVHRLLKGSIKGSKLSMLLQGEDTPWAASTSASAGEGNGIAASKSRQLLFSIKYEKFSWHPHTLGSLSEHDLSLL